MTLPMAFVALAFLAAPEPESMGLRDEDQAESARAEARAREDQARQEARLVRADEQAAREGRTHGPRG